MLKRSISQSDLVSLLNYDPETGIITWKVSKSKRVKVGQIAGSISRKNGYREIIIDGCYYYAHRIAWFYMHGFWPRLIDHRDGDRLNNRIDNLREATVAQNAANRKLSVVNQCGFKGVRATESNRWRATIEKDSQSYHLGMFDTPEEANAAYLKAAEKLFGEFSRQA